MTEALSSSFQPEQQTPLQHFLYKAVDSAHSTWVKTGLPSRADFAHGAAGYILLKGLENSIVARKGEAGAVFGMAAIFVAVGALMEYRSLRTLPDSEEEVVLEESQRPEVLDILKGVYLNLPYIPV